MSRIRVITIAKKGVEIKLSDYLFVTLNIHHEKPCKELRV